MFSCSTWLLGGENQSSKLDLKEPRTAGSLHISPQPSHPDSSLRKVDNGFFANWLQLLDAAYFAPEQCRLEADWVSWAQVFVILFVLGFLLP